MLQGCATLAKEKLGIEHPMEGMDPLEAFKGLVEEVVKTSARSQYEIQDLKRANKEMK